MERVKGPWPIGFALVAQRSWPSSRSAFPRPTPSPRGYVHTACRLGVAGGRPETPGARPGVLRWLYLLGILLIAAEVVNRERRTKRLLDDEMAYQQAEGDP